MTIEALAVLVAIVAFTVAMVYVGVMDVLTMTIDNRILLLLLVVCAVSAPLSGISVAQFGFNLLSALIVFFVGASLFVFGWIGGGDCKFATVTAVWMGADHTFEYISHAALFGGVLTLALLLFRSVELPPVWLARTWVARLHSRRSGVPYGVALALAGLYTIKDTPWLANLV
jgi:prepilin peptidase CpaA